MNRNLLEKLKDRLFARWVACRVVSDKRSVQYGAYFSYPIYISMVVSGVVLANPLILLIAALIAFCGIKLPIHPFDYVYNYTVSKLLGTSKIPGRGSELQVNSTVALVFNLVVLALITTGTSINYTVLATIYALSSIFFIAIFWIKD